MTRICPSLVSGFLACKKWIDEHENVVLGASAFSIYILRNSNWVGAAIALGFRQKRVLKVLNNLSGLFAIKKTEALRKSELSILPTCGLLKTEIENPKHIFKVSTGRNTFDTFDIRMFMIYALQQKDPKVIKNPNNRVPLKPSEIETLCTFFGGTIAALEALWPPAEIALKQLLMADGKTREEAEAALEFYKEGFPSDLHEVLSNIRYRGFLHLYPGPTEEFTQFRPTLLEEPQPNEIGA